MKGFHRFANPARFSRLARRILPWATGLAVGLIALGLYLALFVVPADYQQGESVRIMFVHVPAAWMAIFCYTFMAGASAAGLIWKHPLADLAAKSTAPIGALFTFAALLTGSLWGKPMWGTWWVWDARLTSVLILFFLYLGYMALWQAIDDPAKAAKAAAILALVGFVNVPIIKYSVDWWNTLHQPASVLRMDGPSIHASMLWPLIIMALGFKAYFVSVLLQRMGLELNLRRIRALRQRALTGAAAMAAERSSLGAA
jgi:heme exporter protein C